MQEIKLCFIVGGTLRGRTEIRGMVKDMGFPCVEVEDHDQACVACQALMPDLIIMNREEGGEDISGFVARLRSTRKGRKPIVICCSFEEDKAHVQQALAAGADSWLSRPLDRRQVEAAFVELGLLAVAEDSFVHY